jgi:hypothetical protein
MLLGDRVADVGCARGGNSWGTCHGMLIGLRMESGDGLKYPQIPDFELYD